MDISVRSEFHPLLQHLYYILNRISDLEGHFITSCFHVSPTRDFFLYRVEKPATEQDIVDCLQDNEISAAKVVKISNSEARYCSFKITVALNDVGNILKPEIWPEGVRIRKFVTSLNNLNNEEFKK